jgi:hypothetical protein
MTKKILINVLVGFAVCFGVWFLIAFNSYGATGKLLEKDYQAQWCNEQGGIQEYVLPDLTRVDCLTDTHAIEVEFAPKKYEAVGQALHYAKKTGKRAGILLIMKTPRDEKHLKVLEGFVVVGDSPCGITVWTIRPEDVK